jgi:tyrosinase
MTRIDPLFFMHHAVSPFSLFPLAFLNSGIDKMVDKLWYDWQHKDLQNMYAFHGGSVQTFNTTLYTEYPNGAPPFLQVSSYTHNRSNRMTDLFLQFNSIVPGDGLLWDKVTVWDTMDTRNDELCYIYA